MHVNKNRPPTSVSFWSAAVPCLLRVAHDFGWGLEAWAVFSNHYHFIGTSPSAADDASNLGSMLRTLESIYRFKTDTVRVRDQFDPAVEW